VIKRNMLSSNLGGYISSGAIRVTPLTGWETTPWGGVGARLRDDPLERDGKCSTKLRKTRVDLEWDLRSKTLYEKRNQKSKRRVGYYKE